jgi:hypothetical protein
MNATELWAMAEHLTKMVGLWRRSSFFQKRQRWNNEQQGTKGNDDQAKFTQLHQTGAINIGLVARIRLLGVTGKTLSLKS